MYRFLISAFSLWTVFSSVAFGSNQIPEEVSALMQDANYQIILNEKTQEARNVGRTLHITSFEVLDLPPAKFVYVMLATSLSSDVTSELTSAGAIVGSIVYDPIGEVSFDGIYFKPADESPGGASVGNK